MSPLEITMLLHLHWSPSDYRDSASPSHANSDAVKTAFKWFEDEGLVIRSLFIGVSWYTMGPATRPAQHILTDRGRAMVQHLTSMQLPVCLWVQPSEAA